MNKKELRKELELLLTKTIDEVLSKKNSTIAKKIRKTTFSASKSVAKKFYKTLKAPTKKVANKKNAKATKSIVVVSPKKKGVTSAKSSTSKAKIKSKK